MKYLLPVLLLLLPILLLNCVITEQASSNNGKVFYGENGTTIIIGYPTTEKGLFPGNFKGELNQEFINYPEMAQRAGIEGKVQLFVYISQTGEVTDVKVTRGIGGGCDEAAWQTMKNSTFTPAKDGNLNPVAARHYVEVIFKL